LATFGTTTFCTFPTKLGALCMSLEVYITLLTLPLHFWRHKKYCFVASKLLKIMQATVAACCMPCTTCHMYQNCSSRSIPLQSFLQVRRFYKIGHSFYSMLDDLFKLAVKENQLKVGKVMACCDRKRMRE